MTDPLDELKDQADRSRKDTDPTAPDNDDTPSLEEAVADACVAIDRGDGNEHVGTRDRNLSALFMALEATGQLTPLGERAASALGRDDQPETQAELLRLLVRYAITDLDTADADESGILETSVDGVVAYKQAKAEQQVEQFSEQFSETDF